MKTPFPPRRFWLLAALVLLTACREPEHPADPLRRKELTAGTWKGHVENGDKPGNGFVIARTNDVVRATFYLLHPDHPDDFGKGTPVEMQTLVVSPAELRFRLPMGEHSEVIVFKLYTPWANDLVLAGFELEEDLDDLEPPRAIELRRVPQ